jgi:hypothetical protein
MSNSNKTRKPAWLQTHHSKPNRIDRRQRRQVRAMKVSAA